MSFFDRLLGRKDSATAPVLSMHKLGRPVWMKRNFESFAREGYIENVIAYRCVRLRAESCSAIDLLHFQGDEEQDQSPLLDVLRRPNPFESGSTLIDRLESFWSIWGNAYLEAVTLDGKLEELHTLRPDRMRVIPGRRGYPSAYEYAINSERKVTFDQEVGRGQVAPILHFKDFHPTDDWYGLSPIDPAAFSIDVHNQASAFNKALLDNSASPSGALVHANKEGASLSEEQFSRLKQEMEKHYQGAKNAGRPLLLDGGLDWKQMGLSPRELEFVTGKREAAREICLAFGVPPMLLGIPGDNTYSNYREANRAFYRSSIIPRMTKICTELSNWFQPLFPGARIGFDLDTIDALADERAAKWEQVQDSEFLSTNEKRQAVGYGRYEPDSDPGSQILVPATQLPLEDAGFVAGGPESDDE